jgi:hypothetical protein
MSKAPSQVGTSTNTTTNVQQPPPYVAAAQQGLLEQTAGMALPYTHADPQPGSLVAPLSANQQQGIDLTRLYADQQYGAPKINVGDYGSITANAAQGTAAQLGMGDISKFFNPYQKDVVATTEQQLGEANDKTLAAIRARQASEGAYGGNRGALEESEQNRNYGNTLASTVAGLNQSGWNTAANLGMGNTQLRQQTGMQNTQNEQQANLFNAQQSLAATAMQDQLRQNEFQRQQASAQALLGAGGVEQQEWQKYVDAPFKALDIFRSVVPQSNYGSTSSGTSSQPIYGPSTFGAVAPFAAIGAGALASDRTLKTDIQKLGEDEGTGLNFYAYRYKGDPKNTPKVVGPMAQDVEKRYPGSTARLGGKMVIKGNAARMLGL